MFWGRIAVSPTLLLCVPNLWPTNGLHVNEARASIWRMSNKPSICLEVPLSIYGHQVRYKEIINQICLPYPTPTMQEQVTRLSQSTAKHISDIDKPWFQRPKWTYKILRPPLSSWMSSAYFASYIGATILAREWSNTMLIMMKNWNLEEQTVQLEKKANGQIIRSHSHQSELFLWQRPWNHTNKYSVTRNGNIGQELKGSSPQAKNYSPEAKGQVSRGHVVKWTSSPETKITGEVASRRLNDMHSTACSQFTHSNSSQSVFPVVSHLRSGLLQPLLEEAWPIAC